MKKVFICEECGAEKLSYPSQPRRFCSLSCRSKWQAANRPMPTKPRRGHTEPCPTCGAPVYRSKGQTDKRFCSLTCNTTAQRNGVEKPCDECGTAMYVVPSMQSSRFCGRECYEKARVKKSGTGRQHNGREVIRDHSGYLRIWEPEHPCASQGRILEHRWVVEQQLGRFLTTEEHVHHVNGVKDDNRPENLEVLGHSEHSRLTGMERQAESERMRRELDEYRRRFGDLT